jgi:hypothetical protein
METCPECVGNSQHAAIICGPGGCRETVLSCDFCGGMGIVSVEAADRWRKGRALRDERVKAGLSPAEGAALRSLTVFEQNEIENGRADIPPRLLAKRAGPQRESHNS